MARSLVEMVSADAANAAQDARKHLRRKAVEFDEADRDGDGEIDEQEFCTFILPRVNGASHTEEDLKEWWALMDVDGDGFIRKDEFFLYALCAASRKCGSGIAAIFRTFDGDGSGSLDEIEFEQALDEMGFGDAATAVFEEHVNVSTKAISYLSLLKHVEERTALPAMRSYLLALASDTMLKVDTSSWSFGGESAEKARIGLLTLLRTHSVRLSDLFQHLDDDGSFSLTLAELKDAFWELGFTGGVEVVDQIYALIDQDGSGSIGFDEFNAWVQGRKLAAGPRAEDRARSLSLKGRLQESFDAGDDAWTAARLQRELSAALAREGLRGIDLLKAWDVGTSAGGGGDKGRDREISFKEYLISLKKLCGGAGEQWYAMARAAAIEAFEKMDTSGDRSISVTELCRWLDPHGRLIAAGRTKRNLPTLCQQKQATPSAPGDGDDDGAADPALAYSPTKLATRLAMVRSFDPDTSRVAASKLKTRPPLWKHKELPLPPPPIKPRVGANRKWREPGQCDPQGMGTSQDATPHQALLTLQDCYRGLDGEGAPLPLPGHAPAQKASGTRSVSASSTPGAPVQSTLQRPVDKNHPPARRPLLPPSPRASNRSASPRSLIPRSDDWYDSYEKASGSRVEAQSAHTTRQAKTPRQGAQATARALMPWEALATTQHTNDTKAKPPTAPLLVPPEIRVPQDGVAEQKAPPHAFAGLRLAVEHGAHGGLVAGITLTPIVIPIAPKPNSCPVLSARGTPRSVHTPRPTSAPLHTRRTGVDSPRCRPPTQGPAPVLRDGVLLTSSIGYKTTS